MTLEEIIIQSAGDEDRDAWNNYIQKKENTSCFNRYEWKSVISKTSAIEQQYLIARSNGIVCGVLPTYLLHGGQRELHLHSIKNGFICDDHRIANCLVNYLSDKLKSRNNIKISLSSPYCFDIANFQSKEKLILEIALEKDVDTMWLALRSKTRNIIRKSQKNGLILKKGGENLRVFYKIYSDRMARKIIPFCSYNFFNHIFETFPAESDIYIAEKDGEAIAAILVLYSNDTATYAYSAFLPGSEKYCPIHFLLWELIKDCIQMKISTLDMGESTFGSGVYNFKIWMGAKPRDVYSYQPAVKQVAHNVSKKNKRRMRSYIDAAFSRIGTFTLSNSPLILRKSLLIRKKKRRPLI